MKKSNPWQIVAQDVKRDLHWQESGDFLETETLPLSSCSFSCAVCHIRVLGSVC